MRAFKVIVDPYVGRIVVMEVISGTITPDLTLVNVRTRSDERLHGLHHLFGAKLVPVNRAVAGDVVVVAKLNDVAWVTCSRGAASTWRRWRPLAGARSFGGSPQCVPR